MDPFDNLRKALTHDEPLVTVVRGHIHIEAALNRFLEHALRYPHRIKYDRWNWFQRVDLAIGLGLREELRTPLKKLGDIRNRFAHRPDAEEVTDEDADGLYDTLSEHLQKVTIQCFEATQKATEELPSGERILTPETLEKQSPRTRLSMMLVTIHAALSIAGDHAAEGRYLVEEE